MSLQVSGAGYAVLMELSAKPGWSTLSSRREEYLFTDLANPLNEYEETVHEDHPSERRYGLHRPGPVYYLQVHQRRELSELSIIG